MLILMLATAALTPNEAGTANNRIPSAELIDKIERLAMMPAGAGPLKSYDRTYTEITVDGRDVVIGQMIDHKISAELLSRGHKPPPPVQRTLMKGILPAFDGGCMILKLYYDLVAGLPPKIICNSTGARP